MDLISTVQDKPSSISFVPTGFIGFQGVKCSHCGATYNIPLGIPSIMCERCGEWVILHSLWFADKKVYKKPDFGFNASVLQWAVVNFSWYKDYLKETTKALEAWKEREKQRNARRS